MKVESYSNKYERNPILDGDTVKPKKESKIIKKVYIYKRKKKT